MPSVLDAVERLHRGRRAGITVHPRADRRHITPDDVRDDRAACCADARRRSSSTSKAIRGPSCSIWSTRCGRISARSCRSCPARSRARPAGSPGRRPSGCPDDRRAAARRAASASACSSMPRPSRSAGPRRSAPIASSSTPSRSRARSSAAPEPARASFAPYAEAARAGALARPRRQRRPRPRPRQPRRCSASCRILDEVSIGHAIMSRALFVGLSPSSRVPRLLARPFDMISSQPRGSSTERSVSDQPIADS